MKLRTILALAYSVLWLGFLLLLAVSWPAKAQAGYCAKWSHGIRCSSNYTIDFGPSCRRVRRCLHWVHSDPYRRYDPHHSEVERRHYRPPSSRESPRHLTERCKWQDRLRVTGTDKLDKQRAEVSAQDAWSSTVETRHGTLYSDIQNAAEMTVTCVRKVPSSIVERAQAAGGLRHHVCEISAVPCPPEVEDQDDSSRAKRRHERRSESPPVESAPARP